MNATAEATLRGVCPALRLNEPMARHTSLAIGGPADYYVEISGEDELARVRRAVEAEKIPVFFVGAGSNLLVADRGIRALVIHLQGDFRRIAFDGETVSAGAAAWMPTLAKQAADQGLSGVESLIGVPGTVGGGLVMNAGTREGVLGDVTQSIDTLDAKGERVVLKRDDADFKYRHSRLEGLWVTGAALRLKKSDRQTVATRIETLLQYRTRTQPLATSNCGSVFKNPPNGSAAQLIDQTGLKGYAVGGAQISERHANFIINRGRATARDVRNLIEHIQKRVLESAGVTLEPEVKMVGDWS